MKKGFLASLTIGFLMLGMVGMANASFLGNDVKLEYFYPTLSDSYAISTATVGNGIEFSNVNNYFDMDISATNIMAIANNNSTAWNAVAFNGWVLSDYNNTIDDIVNVSINVATTMSFDSSRLSFDANSITVNWQGLTYSPGMVLSLDVDFKPVPEPATMMLLGLGLLGLAGVSRRKN